MSTRETTAPTRGAPRIQAQALAAFAVQVLRRSDVPEKDAQTVADVLVWADLRGVDSHGVIRIPSYIEYIRQGRMNPRPAMRVLRETPAILSVDADRAIGSVATVDVMHKVISKAKQIGIGWAVVRNVTHQGALGYYALAAANKGLVGLINTCGTPIMAPYGARVQGVHNSPIAICVPAKHHRPLLLDMAHSIAAGGKIKLAADAGQSIPPDWALDERGDPTTDPLRVRTLRPLGGAKGSGMAIVLECLSSLMAGNPIISAAIPAMLGGASRDHAQNSIVAAIDIAAFTDPGSFHSEVDKLIEGIKSLPLANGHTEMRLPGERGFQTCNDRLKTGIPLPAGTIERLREVADTLGVAFPEST